MQLAYNPILQKAENADIDTCWEILRDAKLRMGREGRAQWQGEYPSRSSIVADVENGRGYKLVDECGGVWAYGAVVFTGEPAYHQLDGKWETPENYVVVHRLAVQEYLLGRGIATMFFEAVEKMAAQKGFEAFRIDTNYDNKEMLHLVEKLGFRYVGDVVYPQGERLAFEKQIPALTR